MITTIRSGKRYAFITTTGETAKGDKITFTVSATGRKSVDKVTREYPKMLQAVQAVYGEIH